MIRFLGLLLIFCAGLAGAAVWLGQMHHLRRAVPEGLPAWTMGISDNSGVRQGEMTLAAQDALPPLTLGWAAKPPTAEGMRWDLRLTGEGVDVDAELLLPFWPDRALIRNGGGGVLLADLPGSSADGLIALTGLTGQVADLWRAPQPSGILTAEARRLSAEGTSLGGGPITGAMDASGTWQIDTTLSGGVSAIEGRISGTLTDASGLLDVTVANPAALPRATRRVLSALGTTQGTALRLTLPLGLAIRASR